VSNLFQELKRRNVFRVGIAYVVATWLLIEASTVLLEAFGAPMWIPRALLILLALGFPIVLFFAWALEITPEGIKKQSEVDLSRADEHFTAKRLDIVTIVLIVIAIAFLVVDRMVLREPARETAQVTVEGIGEPGTPVPATRPASEKSVAVIPFTDRSAEPDPNQFVDGIHDDLLTQLAKIAALKVISRTSVMEYRDTTKNMRTIGEELGVTTIMEGAVQRVGNRVRINAQLIDAATDEHLWAETYDRELTASNVFDIQTEIALAIAEALQAALSPAEEANLERRLTDNLEALAAYQRALRIEDQYQFGSYEAVEAELENALELDPGFAAAWALMAKTKLAQWWGKKEDPALLEEAWAAMQRGRAIDPELPELDIAEGYYHYWGHRDYERALELLTPVLEAYPNSAELHEVIAYVNRRYGDMDKALAHLHRSEELNPRSVGLMYALGESYAGLRDFDSAADYLEKLRSLAPTSPRAYQLGAQLLESRDGDAAAAAHQLRMQVRDVPWARWDYWQVLVQAGEYEMALEASDFFEPRYQYWERGAYPPSFLRGLTHYHAGDEEAAHRELEKALEILDERLQETPEYFGALQSRCLALAALGRSQEALQACELTLKYVVDDAFARAWDELQIAIGFAMVGSHDAAFDLIEAGLEARVGPTVVEIQLYPGFRSLHDTSRWKQLMAAHDTGD